MDSVKHGTWMFQTTENYMIYNEIYKSGKFKRRICYAGECCFEGKRNVDNKIPEDPKFITTETFRINRITGIDVDILDYLPEKYVFNDLDIKAETEESPCAEVFPLAAVVPTSYFIRTPVINGVLVDDMPSPLSGMDAFKEKFRVSMGEYYTKYMDKSLYGSLILNFTVNGSGEIGSLETQAGFGENYNREISTLFKNTDDWKGGKLQGVPVDVPMTVIIEINKDDLKIRYRF